MLDMQKSTCKVPCHVHPRVFFALSKGWIFFSRRSLKVSAVFAQAQISRAAETLKAFWKVSMTTTQLVRLTRRCLYFAATYKGQAANPQCGIQMTQEWMYTACSQQQNQNTYTFTTYICSPYIPQELAEASYRPPCEYRCLAAHQVLPLRPQGL